MKEHTREYMGFTITATPRRDDDSDLWTVDLNISRGEGANRESWLISAGEQAEIDEESLEYCFSFSREVIENELKN
jgi:hypothetical protein